MDYQQLQILYKGHMGNWNQGILSKLIGFIIAIIFIRLDIKDSFPLGYGLLAKK